MAALFEIWAGTIPAPTNWELSRLVKLQTFTQKMVASMCISPKVAINLKSPAKLKVRDTSDNTFQEILRNSNVQVERLRLQQQRLQKHAIRIANVMEKRSA